jgi:hypothetical protein
MFYRISFQGEQTDFARVFLQDWEAALFDSILKKAQDQLQLNAEYTGHCSIDLTTPSMCEHPKINHTCNDCGETWEVGFDEHYETCAYRGGKNNCHACSLQCSEYICPSCDSPNWGFFVEDSLKNAFTKEDV